MIFPEALLRQGVGKERIDSIHSTMARYLDAGLLHTYWRSFVYLERTMENGALRRGLVGQIDLEEYDFHPGCSARIRATEGTVASRIPPRMDLLRDAPLEFPHVILLADDPSDEIMTTAASLRGTPIYDFDLMEDGGHIRGYLISGLGVGLVNGAVSRYMAAAAQIGNGTMCFAVGDGNHSLAAAKACWRALKPKLSEEERLLHPARYALVELENIHDKAIRFEPIHRLLRGKHISALKPYLASHTSASGCPITLVTRDGCDTFHLPGEESLLALAILQPLLDCFVEETGCSLDYIHGEEVLRTLAADPDTAGILLPNMKKSALFPAVLQNGVLPRKTFSMGSAREKRYYLEGKRRT